MHRARATIAPSCRRIPGLVCTGSVEGSRPSHDELIECGIATWKRHVTFHLQNGGSEQYAPAENLSERPWKVELRTLHVNRERLDVELLRVARQAGAIFLTDRVTAVGREDKRVTGVRTASGDTLEANCFIHASGFSTSLFGRIFDIPLTYYGPPKVALWTYFASPRVLQGTALHIAPEVSKYMDWTWEIPIDAETISAGYISAGTEIKRKREEDLPPAEILNRQLLKFPHFAELMHAGPLCPVQVTSFRGRIYHQLAGPNWIIVGEAAAMVDPVTSNGVTAALRHAHEAADLLIKAAGTFTLSYAGRVAYQERVRQLGCIL